MNRTYADRDVEARRRPPVHDRDEATNDAGLRHSRKPKAVVVHAVESGSGLESLNALRQMCQEHGVAFYPSLYRAARAIARCPDSSQPEPQHPEP